MSNEPQPPNLLSEVAAFFASAPSADEILAFRPSQASVSRANELLELNRQNALDDESRDELNQFEHTETLMRLIKARIRATGKRAE